MAKDIEKIIEDTVMPEMEYVKTTKHRTLPIEDVPEIVLPKTKAEMYEEAKDRLEQKTSAVSRAYNSDKLRSRSHERTDDRPVRTKRSGKTTSRTSDKKKVKTVELEAAAAAAAGSASNAESESVAKLKSRLNNLRSIVEEPKWVGSSEELIPFAWRHPLVADIERPSKFYKAVFRGDGDRGELLPAPRDK